MKGKVPATKIIYPNTDGCIQASGRKAKDKMPRGFAGAKFLRKCTKGTLTLKHITHDY